MNDKRVRPSKTLWIAGTLLAVIMVAWLVDQGQQVGYRKELAEVFIEKKANLVDDIVNTQSVSVASETVVTRPYVLLGTPNAKLTVYVESTSEKGESAITGYEYFLSRNPDGTWLETESGACTGDQCRIDGRKALQAAADKALSKKL